MRSNRNILVIFLATTAALTAGVAYAATTRDYAWPRGWHSPLSSSLVKVTTNYQALSLGCSNADKSHSYSFYLPSPSRSEHVGLDLRAPDGTDIHATADGRVTAAGTQWGASWRNVMLITHRDESNRSWTAAYGHLRLAKNPRTGKIWAKDDVVVAGDQIGETWAPAVTGSAAHFHFGLGRGVLTALDGMHSNGGTAGTKCTHTTSGTVSPESTMATTDPVPWVGGIVSWRNPNGSRVFWQVGRKSGVLVRRYIPNSRVRNCLIDAGSIDFGDQPARTLDQLKDLTNVYAQCEH